MDGSEIAEQAREMVSTGQMFLFHNFNDYHGSKAMNEMPGSSAIQSYGGNAENLASVQQDSSSDGIKTLSKTTSDPMKPKSDSTVLYHCSICQKPFTSKGGKSFHEKYHHLEAKLFCLTCQKPFKISSDLDRHMKTHSGERPFPCSDCDKTFICKSSLNQHMRLQHLVGSIYECSVCHKTFCTQQDLERHFRVHTGSRPFQCDKCSKSFTCRSSMNVHKKTHEGKKFPCLFCKKEFYIKSDLMRHETQHTGFKPWKCDKCTKAYSCKSALKVHQKNSHSGKQGKHGRSDEGLPHFLGKTNANMHGGNIENDSGLSSKDLLSSKSRREETTDKGSSTDQSPNSVTKGAVKTISPGRSKRKSYIARKLLTVAQ